jgi:trimethylamine--corrinoid protein Co-methyltransferase
MPIDSWTSICEELNVMPGRRQVLSETELNMIHNAAMDLLYQVGVCFDEEEALTIFKKAGFRLDGKTVFFAEDVESAHLDMLLTNILFCDKPFMGSPLSREAARDCLNMAGMIWGGKEKLDQITATISLITPFSPFRYTAEMIGSVIELARCNQACMFGELIMAGTSGPLNLAGLLAQQTAELLAGVTLTQLVRPGAPVVIGGSSAIMDMRTGSLSMGSPEFFRISSATSQIAAFYGIPARGGCANTDAHVIDYQAGYESAYGIYTALQNGSHFVLHATGILGSYSSMCFEKFIIDEELCRVALEMLKPCEINVGKGSGNLRAKTESGSLICKKSTAD